MEWKNKVNIAVEKFR